MALTVPAASALHGTHRDQHLVVGVVEGEVGLRQVLLGEAEEEGARDEGLAVRGDFGVASP
jgi:hypothetical protein